MKINYINPEHVHSLIDIPTNLNIEDCLKLPKGASSHHINQDNLLAKKFFWGRGYTAFSVSQSQVSKVIEYIKNQREHHMIKNYQEEYDDFILKYRIKIKTVETVIGGRPLLLRT